MVYERLYHPQVLGGVYSDLQYSSSSSLLYISTSGKQYKKYFSLFSSDDSVLSLSGNSTL